MAKIEILTTEQRKQAGKALPGKVSTKLARRGYSWAGRKKRDIVALIEASNEDRMENLVPIRHGRMVQSPFAYFRGSAGIQGLRPRRHAGGVLEGWYSSSAIEAA